MQISPAVMAFKDLHLEGNIIPMEWFQHLKYENGKPDLNAIVILSNIVSDDRQKLDHDLLQKSYQHYVDLFGLSKGQVRDAFMRLEGYGVIKRIFRRIKILNGILPNILFIELNPEKIKQFSRDFKIERTEGF